MHGRIGPDGASRYAADTHDLDSFSRAEEQLARMRTPVLMSGADPHARLFVASFDGTGNDRSRPQARTNPALLYDQIQADPAAHPHVQGGYVAGPGTQAHLPERLNDLKSGVTYDARLEEMYLVLCRQAWQWLREDPDAAIRLVDVGFSRGGEEAAGFARMVHERGIRDPTNVQIHRNRDHLVTRIDYDTARPLLRPPGSVAQAELLFDPVGTGEPWKHDRRPPPSVLTGLQIYAEDERRDLFKGSRIIAPGVSDDGRFLGVVLGGAHGNIGGGTIEDGLSRRALNLGVDYLNSLSDTPFLQKTYLRPDLDVVVRTTEYQPFYGDREYRANERAGLPEDQRRVLVDCVAGRPFHCAPDGRVPEPLDSVLDARFPRRAVPLAPVPATPDEFRDRAPAQQRDDLQPTAPPPGVLHRILEPGVHAIESIKEKLLSQAEAGVRALDASLGREYDASSARMTASLASLAKAEGFDRIDAVVLGVGTPTLRAGENVFIVEGRLDDPTNRVAHIKTGEALATPVEQSLARMALLDAPPGRAVDPHGFDAQAMPPSAPDRAPSHRISV